MEKITPKFKHDCDACILIGQAPGIHGNDEICDWYIHSPALDGSSTLVIRDGDEGPDYASYPFEIFVKIFRQGLEQIPKYEDGARLDWASVGINDDEEE